MVRFIILYFLLSNSRLTIFTFQYGQIYYYLSYPYIPLQVYDLHSNMVRFIIKEKEEELKNKALFTFQYGQIYYKTLLLCKAIKILNLHSNMVRFIIFICKLFFKERALFTFQYGQIYYFKAVDYTISDDEIYIPIWLDLLFFEKYRNNLSNNNLHSNMVRFIIVVQLVSLKSRQKFTFQYGQIYYEAEQKWFKNRKEIYIPIWLDLLLTA